MTDADKARVIARSRDELFAQGVLFAIGLAAEQFPEEVKAALAKVFDLGAIEEYTARMAIEFAAISGKAIEAKELLVQVVGDIEGIETRIDGLRYMMEQIEGRLNKAAAVVKTMNGTKK